MKNTIKASDGSINITGIDNTSSVIINEGSIVYESFQLNDFRGGSALAPVIGAGMLNNQKRV